MIAQNAPLDPPRRKWPVAAADLPFDLRQLRIMVIHPRDQDGEFLLRNLQRLRCEVDLIWPPPNKIEMAADIAFCLLQVDTASLCSELMYSRQTAIAAIVDPADPRAPRLLAAIAPQVVITKPFEAVAILTNLVVAFTNSRYQRRLLNKIAKLEETLRSIRTVERAKLVLMKARNIDESEAYAYLRDQAMRKRISIGSVASVVVESGNILLGSKD